MEVADPTRQVGEVFRLPMPHVSYGYPSYHVNVIKLRDI